MTNPYQSPGDRADVDSPKAHYVTIVALPFRAFVLICACLGMTGGLIVGITWFVGSLILRTPLGEPFDGYEFFGITAGLAGLIFWPLYFTALCCVVAVPTHFVFRWFLSRKGGLRIPETMVRFQTTVATPAPGSNHSEPHVPEKQ